MTAAIAAVGLLILYSVGGKAPNGLTSYSDASAILDALTVTTSCPLRERQSSDREKWNANTTLIFGDYFFLEALLRLQALLEGKPQ